MQIFSVYYSFYSPLFKPEAFHTENYTEITQYFYKQKSPREEALEMQYTLWVSGVRILLSPLEKTKHGIILLVI